MQYTNPLHRFAVSCDMELIRTYDVQISKLEAEIVRQAKKDQGRDYHLLNTVQGIGRALSMTILFEIDTIERFPTVKDFLSYCRLVKGSVASAGKIKGLTGGKMGNAYLRWAFGEAAIIAKRNHPLLTPNASLPLRSRKEPARTETNPKSELGRRNVNPRTENTHHWEPALREARSFS